LGTLELLKWYFQTTKWDKTLFKIPVYWLIACFFRGKEREKKYFFKNLSKQIIDQPIRAEKTEQTGSIKS